MKNKVTSEAIKFSRYRWAIKIFVLAICMSCLFSMLSQTILSSMGTVMAVITIVFFIVVSVVFDMVGVAITCTSEDYFLQQIDKEKGAKIALSMKRNSEKVCSFCNDVIGDICGILSGASGACVILSITKHIDGSAVIVIVSSLVSALIAGLTIFSKALMQGYAIRNANKFILKIGQILEHSIFYKKMQKTVDKKKTQ